LQNVTARLLEVIIIYVTERTDNALVTRTLKDVPAQIVKRTPGATGMKLDARSVAVLKMALGFNSVT
jgi:hypothetical protein